MKLKPSGSPELVVPRLEYEHMLKVEGFGEIQHYFEYPSIPGQNWYDCIARSVGEDKIIGIEPSLPSAYRKLIRAKEIRIIDFIDTMRLVKDPGELEAIRVAAKRTDEGMRLVHTGLYRGESTLEPTMNARTIQTGVIKITDYNFMTCSFLTAGWPAPKSSQPHSLPNLNLRMGDGPIVLMSYNRVNGYTAECEKSVFLGEPSERDRKLYDIVMKACDVAYSMVKPGTRRLTLPASDAL